MSNYRFEFYSFEPITLIPSSIMGVVWRGVRQYFTMPLPEQLEEIIMQRRISQIVFNTILKLVFVPLIANFLATMFIFTPVAVNFWNSQSDIYLHPHLEKKAFEEFKYYEREVYFDFFATPDIFTLKQQKKESATLEACLVYGGCSPLYPGPMVEEKLYKKMLDLSIKYNQESIDTLIRLFGDALVLVLFVMIASHSGPQLFIFKSVLVEVLSSLHDITRALMLIFGVNFFVGYHSPRSWEWVLQTLIDRGNWPLGETFILLVIGTLPVFIDTCFKYWVFRTLNKSLPTTVVTYHRMIE